MLFAHDQSALDPKSSAASEIADLWWFMLIASVVVVAVVLALILLAVLRRRGRAGDRLAGRLGGIGLVYMGGAVVPVLILAVLFVLTMETLGETAPEHVHPEMTIEVTGRQWFWDVRYPGTEDAITANEIHVPVGVPVEIEATTDDVLHSFWVPQLNRKIDMIPGRTTRLTFEADEAGVFRGQCAEYCGIQHANMAFLVVAQEPAEFRAWLDRQTRPAETASVRGEEVFMREGCADCHTIRGTDADGDVGPDLTHLAGRRSLAAVTLENSRGHLGGWVLDPQAVKPGNKMPGTDLSGEETQALLDFLQGLE